MAEINEIVSKEAIQGILNASKGLSNLDQNLLKLQKNIQGYKSGMQQVEKSTATATQKNKEYNKLLNSAAANNNKLVASTKQLSAQQKQLTTTEAKLATAHSRTNKQLTAQKLKLQESRAATKRLVKAQQAERGSKEQLVAVNAILEKRLSKVNMSTEQGREKAARLTRVIDKNNKKITEYSSAAGKQSRNIGNYSSAFDELGGQFPMVTRGVRMVNMAFKALLANPIIAVIAAVVAVFAGLVKIFTDTDEGGTKVESIMNGLKAVFQVLKNRAVDLIQAFSALFSGNFKEAANKFKESVSGVGEAMQEAYDQASKYVVKLDELEDRITGSISSQATTLKNFREYIALSKDQTKSDEERMQNLEKAQKAAEEYYGNIREWERERFDLETQNAAARIDLTKEELAEFIALDGDRQEELRNSNDRYYQAWNQLGDDTIKALEEQYAKMDEADTQYFKRTSEITSLRSGLEKKAMADRQKAYENTIKAMDNIKISDPLKVDDLIEMPEEDFDFPTPDPKEIEEFARQNEIAYQQQIMLIRTTSKTEEEAAQRTFELNHSRLQSAIDGNKKLLENSELTVGQRMEIENNISEQQMELDSLVYDHKNELREEDEEKEKEAEERRLERTEKLKEASINTANEIFNFRSAMLDNELTRLEQQKEAGQITEEKYAKKKAELERKQAQTQKAQALFNVAINTAQAVSKIWAEVPKGDFGTMTLILTGLAIANGAMQAATIASKPLPAVPEFAEGTHGKFNTPETFIAGEAGREILEKDGKSYMVDKPTLLSGFKGARIRSNPETEYIMNWQEHGGMQGSKYDAMMFNEMKGLRKDIKTMKKPIYDKSGNTIGFRQNNHTKKILNLYKYGNIQ